LYPLNEIFLKIPIVDKFLIFDCCNYSPDHDNIGEENDYYGLDIWLAFKGTIILSSSRRGLKSYFLKNKVTLFFKAFSNVIGGYHHNLSEILTELNRILKVYYKEFNLSHDKNKAIIQSTISFLDQTNEEEEEDIIDETNEPDEDQHIGGVTSSPESTLREIIEMKHSSPIKILSPKLIKTIIKKRKRKRKC